MLSKSYRLKKKEVEKVFKKGKVLSQTLVLLRFLPNRANHPRYSVVISKKVLAHAVDRNRLKRLIYEWLGQKNFSFSYDLAINIKAKIEENKLAETLSPIFERLQ